ncbi:hypothetical protein GLOIN_2v1883193 [Rhizophagus irregularis DAOM 181602=DAOM 197198]|uniref:Uncharacterized protein n=1 Tax=Rhizophagus irregularis (strain DAOM 181602 / DAOM 197198 / MUCL 43194) TaxID=747089 RepID=A0A2P4P9H5_RHIID|nr:hypothetical protein GLOIN_2v1883193 [Rhizophagus irregularis DAOM 181602=DAOM 197198]POG62039.1 hypothetical protein GLOIN_2v1883193 [Rhizophagus irregularis DAOM 181602=DAOM 197198]|eukprot:XP_025168905.1 hypothetical protein GLOIN_2v1883193 [Rhizophagus irregularis DAOM 181602=DAOM 197198]
MLEKLVMQYASGGDLLRQYLQDNFVEIDCKKFYGIIPITPEILSNIGQQSFVHFSHDENLIIEIINGLRPEIIKGTPKSYLDLMIKLAEIERIELVKSNDWILFNSNYKNPEAFYFSRDLNF